MAVVDAVGADLTHQVHAHRVAAEGEEQAVPERQDSGIAPHEVHRQRDDRVADDLAAQAHPVLGQVQRAALGEQQRRDRDHDQQCGGEGSEREPAARAIQAGHASSARPFSANRPCGRFWMKMMMNTSTAIFASTAPDHDSSSLLTSPRPMPA